MIISLAGRITYAEHVGKTASSDGQLEIGIRFQQQFEAQTLKLFMPIEYGPQLFCGRKIKMVIEEDNA